MRCWRYGAKGTGRPDFSLRDSLDALLFPGLWKFMRRYPGMCWWEIKRSLSRDLICQSLQRLAPLSPGGARPCGSYRGPPSALALQTSGMLGGVHERVLVWARLIRNCKAASGPPYRQRPPRRGRLLSLSAQPNWLSSGGETGRAVAFCDRDVEDIQKLS